MVEIKFLGTGGKGVVIASEIFARACFEEGIFSQCFSIFRGERRGAPVAAFVRVSDKKIYLKCDIDRPNHLILFDSFLLRAEEATRQVTPGGTLLLNMGEKHPSDALKGYKVGYIHALEISKKNVSE